MIGVSCTEFSAYDFTEVINEVAKQFDHWEIFAEAEHRLKNVEGIFAQMKDNYKLSYSIHAPISDINIASINERIREDSVMEILATVESAINLEIGTITVHPGITPMAVPYMEEKAIVAAKKSLRSLDRITQQYGITIALENMPAFPFMLGRTAEELKELFDGTDLRMCFDIGHANTTEEIDNIIDAFKDRFANIHIHDNNGDADSHMVIGEGNIDFEKVISKLKGYRGNFIIESKSFQDGVESQERLRSLLS